jgi:3-oxoacyl-[acyl-carrier protein] reductase
MNISTMHWTYSSVGFILFLATDFKFEEAAPKENYHEKDSHRNRRIPRYWTYHRSSPRSRRLRCRRQLRRQRSQGRRGRQRDHQLWRPRPRYPDVKQLFEKTLKAFGQIDVVVNNAGIMPLSPIAKGDVEAFDKVIATNLRGTFLVFSQAAQHVAEGGRIIAFSSSVLAKNFPAYGPYIASKAGVEGLVHVLANELRGHKITVNAIAPGPVGTELFLDGKTEEQIKQISSMAPLERLGQPDDIANVVSFLAGPDGGWVNAQILRANGGFA